MARNNERTGRFSSINANLLTDPEVSDEQDQQRPDQVQPRPRSLDQFEMRNQIEMNKKDDDNRRRYRRRRFQEQRVSSPIKTFQLSQQPLVKSFAGLDMNEFIRIIRFSDMDDDDDGDTRSRHSPTSTTVSNQQRSHDMSPQQHQWTIASEGIIYQWNEQRQRFRKFNYLKGHRNMFFEGRHALRIWGKIRNQMTANNFIMITTSGKTRVMLYYCHQLVFTIPSDRYILLLGDCSIYNGTFIDPSIPNSSIIPVDRMRNITLQGDRSFKIRIQSSMHRLFVCNDDLLHEQIKLSWIQQLPNSIIR